jgi:hypothetical protein
MPIQPITILPENAVTIIRGTSKTLELVVTDADGKAADLTGAKVIMTVKEHLTDTVPLVQKTSEVPAQAQVTVPREGKARIYLVPADTQTLATKQYVFDVWAVLASGKRFAVVQPSTFIVQASVTVLAL